MNIPFTISGLRSSGLTQAQIGEEVGVAQSTICNMASGKSGTKRPSHELVTALAALAQRRGVDVEPAKSKRTRRSPP